MNALTANIILRKSLVIIIGLVICAGVFLGLSALIHFDTLDLVVYFRKIDLGNIFFSNVALILELR